MAAVKTSPPRSTASPASSPEAMAPEQTQPVQKRKGGRKPVYATQEERKMRNRAAQAAFRERRTEYIKHLEATIKHHEEQLSGLQQSSRNAADEVLMLRYKNSLLERILLEKGIDVTAELRAVAHYEDRPPQSAIAQPAVPPQGQAIPAQPVMPPQQQQQQQQQMHRPVVGRPQAPLPKRSLMNPGQDAVYIKASPDALRPIPTSRNASPSIITTIPTPPGQSSFQLPPQGTAPQQEFRHGGIPPYYPSPYQTHMEELGKLPREYDAELLDNAEDDTQGHLDQQPTPNDRADTELNMRSAVTQPPEPTTQAPSSSSQPGLYGVGMFDSGFESMFASEQAPKHDAGLTDIMRQYNQMPFSFATSNLR